MELKLSFSEEVTPISVEKIAAFIASVSKRKW